MSFSDHLAAADAVAAGYFDETAFTAVAMAVSAGGRDVNAARVPDPGRPTFAFCGTLDAAPEFTAFATGNRPTAADRQVRQISRICLTALASGWPWVPRQGDRIRSATALYEVAASPDRDGTDRLAFWLTKVSG